MKRPYLVTTEANEGPLFHQARPTLRRRDIPQPVSWTITTTEGVTLVTECAPFVVALTNAGRVAELVIP